MAKDSVYISFEDSDFIGVRKSLLGSTISTINLLKKYKEFKWLKTEENKLKKELRGEIKACQEGITNFIESIPKVKEALGKLKGGKSIGAITATTEAEIPKKIKVRVKAGKKKSKLDEELESIKEKLASLG